MNETQSVLITILALSVLHVAIRWAFGDEALVEVAVGPVGWLCKLISWPFRAYLDPGFYKVDFYVIDQEYEGTDDRTLKFSIRTIETAAIRNIESQREKAKAYKNHLSQQLGRVVDTSVARIGFKEYMRTPKIPDIKRKD